MTSQYVQRYAEAEAGESYQLSKSYQHCLVIPAYKEPASVAGKLHSLIDRTPGLLIILVLNHPQEDSAAANNELRDAIEHPDILLIERAEGLPCDEGVGLARKMGCDIACALMEREQITDNWIHCTDADAQLPAGYFALPDKMEQGIITRPFRHALEGQHAEIMALYELRLHDYVLKLRECGSPYGFHTLGSCISIRRDIYEAVRGFPRRAGGEDFYLLNKAAKTTDFYESSDGSVILDSRLSDRVPFGTGPALLKLATETDARAAPLFYHESSYTELAIVLASVHRSDWQEQLSQEAQAVLTAMGIDKARQHCEKQSRDQAAYIRHFHQWFDGFRTLKFLHGLREKGLSDQSFQERFGNRNPVNVLAEFRETLDWR